MSLQRLVFDVTDADTRDASANVGSWVRAGTDGDLIGSKLISSSDWLQVAGALFDGAGTALTSTLVGSDQALDVYMVNDISVSVDGVYDVSTNANPDNVGIISHVRSASPADAEQTFRSTGGAANADDVVAANVFGIDTNAFAMLFDGTTWDRARGTAGAIHIHDGGNSITVDGTVAVSGTVTTSDAALANTAVTNEANSVSNVTEESLVTTILANRKYLFAYNNGNKVVYLGGAGVTTSNGFPMPPGSGYEFRAGAAVDVKAIAAISPQDCRNLQLS